MGSFKEKSSSSRICLFSDSKYGVERAMERLISISPEKQRKREVEKKIREEEKKKRKRGEEKEKRK